MNKEEPLKEIRILIVEDSKTQAMMLINLLDVRGYEITYAINGVAALEILKKERPDIILSDVVMPQMGGYELCKTIKADSDLADIPVVLLTSMSEPQNLLKALLAGADSFLAKPYKIQAVINCIQTILTNPIENKTSKNSEMMEIEFLGQKESLKPNIRQITNFLLSSYEFSIEQNNELEYLNEKLSKALETIKKLEDQMPK